MTSGIGKYVLALLVAPLVASIAGNIVGSVLALFSYDEIYGVQDLLNGLPISYLVVFVVCVVILLPMHLLLLKRLPRPALAYAFFGFLMGCALAVAILIPYAPYALRTTMPGGARVLIEVGLVCGLTMMLASWIFWRIVRPNRVQS